MGTFPKLDERLEERDPFSFRLCHNETRDPEGSR